MVVWTVLVVEPAVELPVHYEVVQTTVSVGSSVVGTAAEGWDAAHCGVVRRGLLV